MRKDFRMAHLWLECIKNPFPPQTKVDFQKPSRLQHYFQLRYLKIFNIKYLQNTYVSIKLKKYSFKTFSIIICYTNAIEINLCFLKLLKLIKINFFGIKKSYKGLKIKRKIEISGRWWRHLIIFKLSTFYLLLLSRMHAWLFTKHM